MSDNTLVQTIPLKTGGRIEIHYDHSAESPRENCDCLATMALFHKRYRLGDKDHGIKSEDYSDWDEMETDIRKRFDVAVMLPVYMLDHSGITIQCHSFRDMWDSGQVGYIFATKAQLREWYCVKRLTKKQLELAERGLLSEVEEYDQFLRGECYCWAQYDVGGECVNGCGGYIGRDAIDIEVANVVKRLDGVYSLTKEEEADLRHDSAVEAAAS